MIFTTLLKTCFGIMIPTMMVLSIGKITSTKNIMKSYYKIVIMIMMDKLLLVKCTNVLSILKMIGEMITAQNLNMSIVTVPTDHIDLILLNRKFRE